MDSRTVIVQSPYPVGSNYSSSSPGSTPRTSSPTGSPASHTRVPYGDHLTTSRRSGNVVVIEHHGARLDNGDPHPSYSRTPQHHTSQ